MNQPESLQAGTRVDDYAIEATFWTTNSGFIYRAKELDRGQDVLIQEYLPPVFAGRHPSGVEAVPHEGLERQFEEGLIRFLREARILAQINDPYVCRVYEYTEANATAYMVLDYEPGQTLQARLKGRRARLDETEIRKLLVPLLKGLRVAHAADLLHRDIHPANIYLRDVGPPVLIGFGSPVMTARDIDEPRIEYRFAPGYSPVEQYQSDAELGPWSDLYALGATMYRCLAGTTPVEATRRITDIAQNKEDPLMPALELGASDYSAALLSAIDWMMEPMAADRPESASAVLGPLNTDRSTRQADGPQRDPGTRGAPLPPAAPAAEPPGWALRPRPVVDLYRSTNGRQLASFPWTLPLAVTLAAVVLAAVLLRDDSEPGPSVAATAGTQESVDFQAPAPPGQEAYPPPELPETVHFGRKEDDARAALYRGLERRTERIETSLAAAARDMAEGRLVSPAGDNALVHYRSVLTLHADNTDAERGIAAIQRKLVEAAEAAFATQDIAEANRLLDQAADVAGDNERGTALRRAIERHQTEAARQERLAREQERRREAARRRAEQARRDKVQSLIERADVALRDGRLTQPPGDNALAYYQRALRLAPEQSRARQGVEQIGRRYLDRALDALAQDELDRADGLLTTAAAIMPDNESVPLLRKQLETRRAVAERERRKAERQQRSQARRQTALSDTAGRLSEGVRAYYTGDYETAFRLLNPLAEQGEPRAKFRVAMMYQHGRGVEQDPNLTEILIREALPAIRKQAADGVAWAQADLASLYADGIVLAENDEEAVRLYTLAAQQGYAGAQTNLGVMYANGEGVSRNREDAVLWFRRAAAQGDRIAQNNLQALGVQ